MMEQFRHALIRVQCALEPLARTIIIRSPACFICSELGDDTIYMHPRRVHSRHTRSALLDRYLTDLLAECKFAQKYALVVLVGSITLLT
jgi:hypothetical protein